MVADLAGWFFSSDRGDQQSLPIADAQRVADPDDERFGLAIDLRIQTATSQSA